MSGAGLAAAGDAGLEPPGDGCLCGESPELDSDLGGGDAWKLRELGSLVGERRWAGAGGDSAEVT